MAPAKRPTTATNSAAIQWVPNGPELPVELLESLEDGDLILFCGAGISVPAGLPTFKNLVRSVYDFFPDTSREIEDLIESSQYDRAFYALEAHYGKAARRQLHKLLELQPSADRSTHEALLRLATGNDGRLRLVTTNFDLAFESENTRLCVDCAPKLPIPKKERWNSLVYLHGRLATSDPECENLILSSADFGQAYLTERWASRFVTELFRRFKILFIGYSADDPVMRYMLDAFAADRAIGESVSTAFAFTAARPEEVEKVAAEWNGKRVQPIIYEIDEDGHGRLHSTIKHWAERHSLGLQGKASIIHEHAHSPTVPSSRQQVCWALRDITGNAARTFANLEPPPPFEWLQHLENAGLLNIHRNAFSDDARIVSPLCSGSRPSDPQLHLISAHLANWLTKHLKDRRLTEWVIERGSHLHEYLRLVIRRNLSEESSSTAIPNGLRRFWEIVSSEAYAADLYSLESALLQRLNDGQWNPILCREVIAALTPFLRLEKGWSRLSQPASEEHLSTYANGALILRAEQHAAFIYQALLKHKQRSRALLDLADNAGRLLDRLCDLLTLSENAGDGFDNTYISRPSIEQHEQNRDHYPWLKLVSLARDAFLELNNADRSRARALADHWRASRVPLLRRFAFFAAAKTGLFTESECVDLLLDQDKAWLWSHFVQREAFQLLEKAWPGLGETSSGRLVAAILSGPPRKMFRNDIGDEVYFEFKNKMVQRRLECLIRTGAPLPPEAQQVLAELRTFNEPVGVPEDRRHFPSWSTIAVGDETLHRFDSKFDLRWCSKEEQIQIAADITPDSPYWPTWRLAIREDIHLATELLVAVAAEAKWPAAAWKELLLSVPSSGEATSFWPKLCTALCSWPDPSPVENEISLTLRDISKSLPVDEENCFWAVWDGIAPGIANSEVNLGDDILFQALNSASGALAETVLNRMDFRKAESADDIPEHIWNRLTLLVQFRQAGSVPSQVFLASRLSRLFELKPGWVQHDFLPLFNWERNPNAAAVWQGYLWQFGMPSDLWQHLKRDFLEAVRRFASSKVEENAVSWLIAICIRQPAWIDYKEATDTLQAITSSGRSSAARTLWDFMRTAGENADALWRDRIGKWLQRAWPRDQNLRSPSISRHLALAVINTQEEFPEASRLIADLIVPSPDFALVTWQLKEKGSNLPDIYPRELLRMLGTLFDNTAQGNDGSFREVLDRIALACPDCISSLDYRRLTDWDLVH